MANPISPVDGSSPSGFRLGFLVHKVGTTLTAVLTRAIAKASTSGATDVGWIGVGTHVEDEAAVVADASATPLALIGGKVGSHVTVSAAGDVGAIQADALGALMVNSGGLRATTILASAARTATPTKVDQTNYAARGVIVVIDVTAITATPSVTFTIQGKDPLSGKYFTILASAAITGVGTTVLRVAPGLTAAANLVANDVLPQTWAVDAVHGDSDSITYSVGALYVK
jgi:hypothetical protein